MDIITTDDRTGFSRQLPNNTSKFALQYTKLTSVPGIKISVTVFIKNPGINQKPSLN